MSARSGAINVESKHLTIITEDKFDDFDSNWLNFFTKKSKHINRKGESIMKKLESRIKFICTDELLRKHLLTNT